MDQLQLQRHSKTTIDGRICEYIRNLAAKLFSEDEFY